MRKDFADRATDAAAAHRQDPNNPVPATLARVLSVLLGLVLLLQVAGLHHPVSRVAAAIDTKATALASLAAAIGHPATLCEHGSDPSRPGSPADSAGCEHCIFCHSVAAGLAETHPVATDIARFVVFAAIERPCQDTVFVRTRHRGRATPRGPPAIG